MKKVDKHMSIVVLFVIIVIIIINTLFAPTDEQSNPNFVNGSTPNQNSTDLSNTLNLSNNIGHSEHPNVAVHGNSVYAVWVDDSFGTRDIYFRKSTDNGCTFGPTRDISNLNGGSVDPQIAVSENNVYVVWEHAPENNGAIFFTKSSDNGISFEKIRNISNNTGFNGFPQIAVSGKNVYLVWHDATHGISFAKSTDNGINFEKIRIISDNTGFNGFPQIAVNGSNLFIVWTNNAEQKHGKVFFTRSTDGGSTFDIPVALTNTKDSERHALVFSPRIAIDPQTSGVYVVWHSGRTVHQETYNLDALISDVIYTRSTDGGSTFDNTVNLSNKSGWSINPQIAVSQGNNVYVTWTNNATGNEETILSNPLLNNCTISNPGNSSAAELDNKNPGDHRVLNIAFVDPTFTIAAYDKSFYMFYPMYDKKSNKYSNITEDIGLLSSILPQNYEDRVESHDVRNHLKWLLPKSNIDRLTDQDVDKGLIFTNGTNKYHIIVLSHEEYVTQREYDNFKRFVANGGVLVLLDGNVFYAEVKYDENTNSISLVKGHYWQFDGKSARRSVEERWANETSEWIGSNFLCCWSLKIKFNNNPFEMGHDEEQHITNPKAKILLDYNATEDEPNPRKFTVATYELDYKKGKVIALGLYTDHFTKNERFWKFFDSLLFQYALNR